MCPKETTPSRTQRFANRPTAEALRVWLQIQSQFVISRANWLVDNFNYGSIQIWGLVAGILEFKIQAPKSPWHELWEKNFLQIKKGLANEIPVPTEATALLQHFAIMSTKGRNKFLDICLSFRNREILDRDVFCPDCSARFLDDRWLQFQQKRVHHDPLQTPEDALLDVPEYNLNGIIYPCCRFCFSCCQVVLIHHISKWKIC